MKKHIIQTLLALLVLTSCSDDMTSQYSNKYPVRCTFTVLQYEPLIYAVGNIGQFATIRKSSSKVIMTFNGTSTPYQLDATQKYFDFGLGGLIAGTAYDGTFLSYDLACPNCDRASTRLSVGDNATAKCPSCGIEYSLNYNGIINSVPDDCKHTKPRGLYRYRIVYNGTEVSIYN